MTIWLIIGPNRQNHRHRSGKKPVWPSWLAAAKRPRLTPIQKPARRPQERQHELRVDQGVTGQRYGSERQPGASVAGGAGRGGGPIRLGGILLCRASQSTHAGRVSAGGAAIPCLG